MNKPYGADELVNSVIQAEEDKNSLQEEAKDLKSVNVPDRFLSDCEMLAIGAFTPLEGFMNEEDVDSVVKNMRLSNGLTWGIPIILLVSEKQASGLNVDERIAIKDGQDRLIALMNVNQKFTYPKEKFCQSVFGTDDLAHPGVKMIMDSPGLFLAGPVELVNRPQREEVPAKYYLDPAQTRREFKARGWETIVAFQTRNPIHRAHEYLIKCALESVDGVLIHPLVGETKPDDIPAGTRMKCYQTLIENYFNPEKVLLSVLPTFMRYAGPKEAINHAIIRKNYGCTHFIIGRDHAGVGDYYGTYEAQEMLLQYADKIGITPVKFEHAFFCQKCEGMASSKTCPHPSDEHVFLSGTKVRAMLQAGEEPPHEFTRHEVAKILLDWAAQSKPD